MTVEFSGLRVGVPDNIRSGNSVAVFPAIRLADGTPQRTGRKLRWALAVSLLVHTCGLWGLAAWYPQSLPLPTHVSTSPATETILLSSLPETIRPIADDSLLEKSAVTIMPHQAIMGSHVFHYTAATDVTLAELLTPPITAVALAENFETPRDSGHSPQPVIPLFSQTIESILNELTSENLVPEQTPPGSPAATSSPASSRQATKLIPPDLHGNNLPRYPEQARRLGWQGRVLLRIWIDEQGSVTRVRVEESSGYLLLDAAAVTSIRTWRVKPAQRNGQPVAGSWLLPIRFRQQR